MIRGRGIVGKPGRGQLIPLCCYCGTGTWNGGLMRQPDGNLLHEHCQEPAARNYPNSLAGDGEQVDAKVRWLDVRGAEDDAGAFWA